MTVSGTTLFNPDFTEFLEEAWDRAVGSDAGGPRSGYDARTARRSINILFADWANRGLNLWTYSSYTETLTYNVGEYVLDNDASLVDILDQTVQLPPGSTGLGTARLNMTRVSVSTQATRTNPDVTGRPTEVFYQRGVTGITAHIWPLPDGNGPYVLVYWALRRIYDAGAYTNTADLPFRFIPAFIAGLAFYIAQKKQPDNIQLLTRLETDYEKTFLRAAEEDRDKSVLSIVPRGSSYRVGLN